MWKRSGRKKAGKEKVGEVGKINKNGKKKTRERKERKKAMEGEKEGRRRDGGTDNITKLYVLSKY